MATHKHDGSKKKKDKHTEDTESHNPSLFMDEVEGKEVWLIRVPSKHTLTQQISARALNGSKVDISESGSLKIGEEDYKVEILPAGAAETRLFSTLLPSSSGKYGVAPPFSGEVVLVQAPPTHTPTLPKDLGAPNTVQQLQGLDYVLRPFGCVAPSAEGAGKKKKVKSAVHEEEPTSEKSKKRSEATATETPGAKKKAKTGGESATTTTTTVSTPSEAKKSKAAVQSTSTPGAATPTPTPNKKKSKGDDGATAEHASHSDVKVKKHKHKSQE